MCPYHGNQPGQCRVYLLVRVGGDFKDQFVDRLMKTYTSEAVFLLTTLVNMARARPADSEQERDFISTIVLEIFEVCLPGSSPLPPSFLYTVEPLYKVCVGTSTLIERCSLLRGLIESIGKSSFRKLSLYNVFFFLYCVLYPGFHCVFKRTLLLVVK